MPQQPNSSQVGGAVEEQNTAQVYADAQAAFAEERKMNAVRAAQVERNRAAEAAEELQAAQMLAQAKADLAAERQGRRAALVEQQHGMAESSEISEAASASHRSVDVESSSTTEVSGSLSMLEPVDIVLPALQPVADTVTAEVMPQKNANDSLNPS